MESDTRPSTTPLSWGLTFAFVVILGSIGAAVILPNIGGGRHRSMVSRVRADMRALATAIESYYVDQNAYPAMRPLRETAKRPEALKKSKGWNLMTVETGRGPGLFGLTTPIPYITSMFGDPYTAEAGSQKPNSAGSFNKYAYHASANRWGWILFSPGPDGDYDITDPDKVYDPLEKTPSDALIKLTYDPTNGSTSNGDVYRLKQ